jgi:hypothetical protein
MSSFLVLWAAVGWGAEIPDGLGKPSSERIAQQRRFDEYCSAIDEVLRSEALARDQHERGAAIRRMTALYGDLRRDPRLATSDTLKSYKAKLWSRMTRVKKDLQRQLDRETKLANQTGDAAEARAIQEATRSLADQVGLMNYTMGGPGYVFTQTSGAMGGGTMEDYGQTLIDLIERTIQPSFWDTAGGPGSMFYFRPLMALVVSATSEVHGDVSGLLEGLRRAGN